MPRYHNNAKQVLRDGKHFADCIDDGAARLVAEALNERKGMPQTQQSLPLDGADGPLFIGDRAPPRRGATDWPAAPFEGKTIAEMVNDGELSPHEISGGLVCPKCKRARQPYMECPRCPETHTVRQENDEYACACGARWDVADGEDHP